LVAGPQVDVPNVIARTRVPFSEFLPGFLVASFGDTTVTALDARYSFASWAMRDATTNVNGGVFPLRLTTLPTELLTQSLSGSGNYFVLSRTAGASASTIRMLATGGGVVGFADARVIVVRLK